MFFWIFAIALILVLGFIALCKICEKIYQANGRKYWDLNYNDPARKNYKANLDKKWYSKVAKLWDKVDGIISVIAIVLAVIVVIMLITLFITYGSSDGEYAKLQARYESLVYQYEHDVYDADDDVVGKKELYNQIQDWNEDISCGKTYTKDFWWGIFWPDWYEDLKFIEYK